MQESVGSGMTRPLAWRKEQLGRLMTLVDQHEQDVLKALQKDLGKPATEAFFEIVALRQELKFTRRNLRRWMGAKRVPVPVALSPGKAQVMAEPLGCVLVIGPWNYPFQLTLRPLISALAAGNTAVLKPSEHAPAVAGLIAKLVAEHFEAGTFPMELVPTIADMGLLGMHLDGYGCAGASAMAYGIACRELEAGDSGLRSFVSVQGSLCMFPIWKYGSEEQKEQWLPGMAAGEIIGCFGLTEPDHGSDPSSMATRAKRDGDGWILNGSKRWITNAGIADIAIVWANTDEGFRGFLVPTDSEGFEARKIQNKLSLRASVTGEFYICLLYTSPSPRDKRQSRMPSSA